MLVTPFALVAPQIGIDRCGPLMTVVVLGRILQASPKTRARQAKLANGEDVLAGDGPIRASGMSETEAMRSTCHPELPGGHP
jgi:hypothetical protein